MDQGKTRHEGVKRGSRRRFGKPALRRVSIVMLFLLMVSLCSSLPVLPAIAQDEAPVEQAPAEVVVAEDTSAAEPVAEQPVEQAPQEQAQEVQQAPAPPSTGSLEIRLTGSTGVALSGLFVVYDAAGTYHERWTDSGVAWFSDLVAGTATIYQATGTTDFAFDDSVPSYIDVPAGSHAVQPIVNAFLDADGDAYGDSIDTCGAGSDAVDTDVDGTPNACDATPNGDTDGDGIDELSDPTPNGDDDADGVDNAADTCPVGDDALDTDADGVADACDETPNGEPAPGETSEIVAEVAVEPVVVDGALVTCQQADAVTPWIATALADYPPGSLVTLTGGNWVAGQTIEVLVEDDGIADAERGPWSHATTVTADADGAFTYQFELAPWYVADYSAVATGECAEASTSFTDALVLSASLNPMQVPPTAPITFSMTVANANTSPDNTNSVASNLGCVRISVPTNGSNGYVNASATSVFASGGKAWSVQAIVATGATTVIVATANGDTAKLAPGEQVTVGFSATTPANSGTSPISVTGRTSTSSPCDAGAAAFNALTFNVTVVQGALAASAAINPASVAASTSQTYTVRITNNGGNALGSAKILIPTGFSAPTALSSSGSGFTWSATYNSAEGKISVDSGNLNNRINPGQFIDVIFTVTAPTITGPRTFTVEAWTNNGFAGSTFGFPAQPAVTVTAPTAACSPAVSLGSSSLGFGTSAYNGSTYPTATGALPIQIASTGTGCSGFPTSWSVQASTSVMTTSGGTIPANAISYSNSGSGTAPAGLTPSSTKSLGGSAQVIATGNATTSSGTWSAGFSLAPPDTTAPGTYTGTITITAATGS